jgi:type I restriction enzyme M protein
LNTRTHTELANFIWSICNLLRGPYKRNEYRKVILPLTVMRRFDCCLAPTKAKVLQVADGAKNRPDIVRRRLLEQASGYGFYNLSRFNFATLLDDPNHIAANLAQYMKDFSPNVREIMERFAFDQQIASPAWTRRTSYSRS